MSLAPGAALGPYEIVGLLGAGGMGEVFRARDSRLHREVAVKILPAHGADSPDRRARFERESRAVAALSHLNILAIFDVGVADSVTYAVTELLEGESLREHLANGPLPVRKSIEIAVQVARGLSAAHDKGIVHRDLKPENVFILNDGRVKILDFGLARIATDASADTTACSATGTDPGVVMGTVGYMAPEQVRDRRPESAAMGSERLFRSRFGPRACRAAARRAGRLASERHQRAGRAACRSVGHWHRHHGSTSGRSSRTQSVVDVRLA